MTGAISWRAGDWQRADSLWRDLLHTSPASAALYAEMFSALRKASYGGIGRARDSVHGQLAPAVLRGDWTDSFLRVCLPAQDDARALEYLENSAHYRNSRNPITDAQFAPVRTQAIAWRSWQVIARTSTAFESTTNGASASGGSITDALDVEIVDYH